MDTTALIQQLRNAHREHLLGQLQHADHWQAALLQLHNIIIDQPIGKLVDGQTLATMVDAWLMKALTTQGLQTVIDDVTLAVWQSASNDDTTVGELFNEAHMEALLEELLKLEGLREKTIHGVMNHPMISEMVSEMLYTGIKNFLSQDTALSKVPGLGGMMKLGRKSVGFAMSGLEDSIREYLRNNIRSTLRSGERWLQQKLSNDQISRVVRDGYQQLAPLKPAKALRTVDDQQIKSVVARSTVIIDESTQLAYTRKLVHAGVLAAVKSLESVTLRELLAAMQLDDQLLRNLLSPALGRGAVVLAEQQVLAPLVDWYLDDFYQSDACKAVFDQA